ncbi:MerR family transcriptional regulator [Nocardiopsis sp. CC223A]|uniref:MerR family transcriptional regulator n=1 Tax=Nocardiopsis sp. CC223A TaxID=3044051 RepID=UPI0027958650|nr:MerR family transcriptional regulator [Nocardiopsis sp. CC223A]
MRIGELSERTETPRRLLRYYEEQGLILPRRMENGYRDYDEDTVDRVVQIRGLLDAGLPTRVIRQMMPCLNGPRSILISDVSPQMVATLRAELERMDRRIRCLEQNRRAISDYLDAVLPAERAATAP